MGIHYAIVDSPLGRLLVAATPRGVCAVAMGSSDRESPEERSSASTQPRRSSDRRALGRWTKAISRTRGPAATARPAARRPGDRLSMAGLDALAAIPYGTTTLLRGGRSSHRQPRASRAVARACASNPVAVAIPCHRVVPSGGVGGYRWGSARKKALLGRELRNWPMWSISSFGDLTMLRSICCSPSTRRIAQFDDDELRPIPLDRQLSEVAGSAFPEAARLRFRPTWSWSAAGSGMRDGVRVCRRRHQGRGRRRRPHRSGAPADSPPAGYPTIPASVSRRRDRASAPRGAHGWQSWRRASLDFIALVGRLELKCNFEQHGALLVAAHPSSRAIEEGTEGRREAGLDAPVVNARAVAGDGRRGGRSPSRRATARPWIRTVRRSDWPALPSIAAPAVFERSPARRITFTRKWVEVKTPSGTIRADRVVVATGTPTVLFKTLARHFWYRSSFLAFRPNACRPRSARQLGTRRVVVRDSAVPPHVIRWVDDEHLLISGADGDQVIPRLQARRRSSSGPGS